MRQAVVAAGMLTLIPGVAIPAPNDMPDFSSRQLPSISARYVELDFTTKDILDQARLELSPDGMRLIRGSAPWRIMLVRYFPHNKTWLVDQGRALTHELDYAEADTAPAAVNQQEINKHAAIARHDLKDRPGAGFLSGFPCKDAYRVSRGHDKQWRGQRLSQWLCRGSNYELIAIDYYSEAWGLVIRSVDTNNSVRELHGIQEVEYGPRNFVPNEKYYSADLNELINGVMNIRRYIE